jgi:hypothetical protein
VEEYILGDLYRRLEIFLSLCGGVEFIVNASIPRVTADDALSYALPFGLLARLCRTFSNNYIVSPSSRYGVV